MKKILLLLLFLLLAGCGIISSGTKPSTVQPTSTLIPTFEPTATPIPTSTPLPTATPIPFLQPGEPPKSLRLLQDNDSSPYSKLKAISSGDNPLNDLYERPFTSVAMVYIADVDILSAEVALGDDFYYFTITLQGLNASGLPLSGIYAIEFDRTLTGRGDLLVMTEKPDAEWSITPVKIFLDNNKDVGGPNPIIADRGFNGDGYETQMAMNQDQVAYARKNPALSNSVQIAVSRNLVGDESKFLWGAWAYRQSIEPGWFDLDDHFGKSQAGSPIRASGDYPLNALHSLDNTCRLNFGFFPQGIIPGMCISGPQPSHPGEACTCIRPDLLSGACYEWYCK